jgi:hypothetical protein
MPMVSAIHDRMFQRLAIFSHGPETSPLMSEPTMMANGTV